MLSWFLRWSCDARAGIDTRRHAILPRLPARSGALGQCCGAIGSQLPGRGAGAGEADIWGDLHSRKQPARNARLGQER
jgi:hypothetical protein